MRRAPILAAALVAVQCVAPAALADPAFAPGPPPSAAPLGPPHPTRQHARCAQTVPTVVAHDAVPAGHRLLDVAGAHRFSRGAGVTVAVIDTGVTPHSRLPDLVAGGDYVSAGDGLSDCDAHGTLVAGIIAGRPSPADGFVGVAPESRIVSIRQSSGAFRAESARDEATVGVGYGPVVSLARALVRAVDLGARVITISEAACLPAGGALGDDAVGRALAHAAARDAVVVAAAGNLSDAGGCRTQNPDAAASAEAAWAAVRTVATPARFAPLVLTVGAVSAVDGATTPFTLRGPWVAVAAPGTDVVSLAPGPRGPRPVGGLVGDKGPMALAGTSYATAYVAGTVALVRSKYPDLSAEEVIFRVARTAHGGGADQAVGRGVIDPVAALTAELPALPPDRTAGRPIAAPSARDPGDPGAPRVAAAILLAALAVTALRMRRRSPR